MIQSAASVFQLLVKRYASRHLWVLLLVATLTLVANLLTVIQPMILAALLANLSGGDLETVPPDASLLDLNVLGTRVTEWMRGYGAVDTTQLLIIFGFLFLTQTLLVSVTNYGADYGATWLRVRYTKMIQIDLLKHLLAQDIAFFSEQKSGGLISRVTRDSADTAFALGPLIRSLIHQSVQIVMYAAYLFSTSIWLTIGAVAFLLLQFGFTELLRRTDAKTRAARDRYGGGPVNRVTRSIYWNPSFEIIRCRRLRVIKTRKPLLTGQLYQI